MTKPYPNSTKKHSKELQSHTHKLALILEINQFVIVKNLLVTLQKLNTVYSYIMASVKHKKLSKLSFGSIYMPTSFANLF